MIKKTGFWTEQEARKLYRVYYYHFQNNDMAFHPRIPERFDREVSFLTHEEFMTKAGKMEIGYFQTQISKSK